MYCSYCKNSIDDDSRFCKWCGSKVEPLTEETMPMRVQQRNRTDDLEIAKIVYSVYRNKSYLPKYCNIAEYGEKELGVKRAQVYNYKTIGEKFLDKDGNLLIETDETWSIAKLIELKALSVKTVNYLISEGIIHAGMTSKKIREAINGIE